MKINPIGILLNRNFVPDKKLYFISGNEKTLMEKIKSIIIKNLQRNEKFELINIDTISDFVEEIGLFGEKNLYLVDSYKGINQENINNIKKSESNFIFFQENSQKIKKVKNLFNIDKDSYLIDCYELDRESKIKILNEFLNFNNFKISKDIYWFLVEKLDSKYIFFENNLIKILQLNDQEITLDKIKKILIVDESGKEKVFFNLFKKNSEIVNIYRNKIITNTDVNELYFNCKFFCQLIIDCNTEDEYSKKIPVYLFREKSYLVEVFRKYNSKKKKMLLELISSTEKILRENASLSLVVGLRFLLNIKKITIS